MSDNMNSKTHFPTEQMVACLFLTIGLLVCLLGVYNIRSYNQIEDELVTVPAVIERIRREGLGNDKKRRAYVSYSYQGVEYDEIRLSWYHSGMDVGDRIDLKIHPDDPSKPVSKGGGIPLFIGSVFTLLGVFFLHILRTNKQDNEFSYGEDRTC